MKILIIDDNKAIRTALKLVLASHFPDIVTVGDPTLIPALLIPGNVDAVILDMNFGNDRLDGSDGIFWLRRIKETPYPPAVILITAFGDIPLAVEAMKIGADDFVTKPWDNEDLIKRIFNAIQRNKKEQVESHSINQARDILQREKDRQNMTLDELKLMHIRETINACDGNFSLAAQRLGINRQTLYNLLRKQ